jgi:hypothetical protein
VEMFSHKDPIVEMFVHKDPSSLASSPKQIKTKNNYYLECFDSIFSIGYYRVT